jgi:hypothetical protein
VNEFIEECRREWRRIGVPDPIANEMAADLTADIEEAESEGGTAEDVLGNSAFDPRHFARSWAVAQGVSPPATPIPTQRRWPVLVLGLTGCAALLTLAAAVLAGGRQSAASAVSIRRFVGGPRSFHLLPGGPVLVQRFQNFGGIPLLAVAFLLLAVAVLGIGIALVCGSRWNGGRIGPWEIRRDRARSGAS